jgi:hypothetical protein
MSTALSFPSAGSSPLPLHWDTEQPPPRVVLAYGLGRDSTAILVKWLTDPSSRDFDLRDLVVITAMTGHEWPVTGALVTQHVLPLLAQHRVRYVQIARRGPAQAEGIDVLADTRRPDQLHLLGRYTLAEEMFTAGTLPQTTGDRLCSQHFKAWPLDTVIARITHGQPYRHVMGYELNERRRATRDATYNTAVRTGEYPLITWGWNRQRVQRFLRDTLHVEWIKSGCVYCPFALATVAGQAETVEKFIAEPEAGVLALVMEFSATALNPTQGLIKGERLHTLLRNSPGTGLVLALFDQQVAAMPWAVYDVRRALTPRTDGKINHARSVEILESGPREAMRVELRRRASCLGRQVTVGDPRFPDDRHVRVWLRHRDTRLPTAEQFLTIAPATAITKVGPAFPAGWAAASHPQLAVA